MVKFQNGRNDLTKIDIVLTDFGLAGKDSTGGTPVFASPECFGTKTHKSDIFSLGRVLLYLMLPKYQFLKWLFIPITSVSNQQTINTAINQNKLLKLISKMIAVKSQDRIDINQIRTEFNWLKQQNLITLNHQSITEIENNIFGNLNKVNLEYVSDLYNLS